MADSMVTTTATVVLDPATLGRLLEGESLERLADLVADRLERRPVRECLLTASQAAEVVGVHPETLRRAIREGELVAAGYIGKRPRVRREDVEAWVASTRGPVDPVTARRPPRSRRSRHNPSGQRLLSDALASLTREREEARS